MTNKSPSLRRIQADVRELAVDPSDRYHAAPLESDMFEWHFTIRGADGTDFEGGIYHGRILLPPQYPFKPPHIVFLTPSGRFDINTKVCLSFSAYHPELWQPAWGIRLILEALISFLPTPADGAIGALDWTSKERKRLAIASQTFCCHTCGKVADLLIPKEISEDKQQQEPLTLFQKEIEQLKLLQRREHEEKTLDSAVAVPNQFNVEEDTAHGEADDNEDLGFNKENSKEEIRMDEEMIMNQPPITEEGIQASSTQAVIEGQPDPLPLHPPMGQEILRPTNPVLRDELDIVWLTDPMLNISIVLLSIVCLILGHKCYEVLLAF